MDPTVSRRLTGMIAARLWLVSLVAGACGWGLVWFGLRPGAVLVTLASLLLPLAVVVTLARLLRQPAVSVPRWLVWIGGTGSATGLVGLLLSPGQVPAILLLAVGVWLLVVGLISGVVVGRPHQDAA